MNIADEKRSLRRELLKKRENYTGDEINTISEIIFGKIKQIHAFEQARTVMLYVSFGRELNTHPFIQYCIENGKQVITPLCAPERTLLLAKTGLFPDGFAANKMGILEQDPKKCEYADESELDLIITPGIAFTQRGERLGYGGGYYDRLFAKMPARTLTICPTFDELIVEYLPTDANDKKVDIIVSEKKIIFV